MEPSKKRQRVLLKTCEACKHRKAKCDSSSPSCEACIKRGIECTYREREQPGLRAGFGKDLEQRLARMEESLQEIRQAVQRPTWNPNEQPSAHNFTSAISQSQTLAPSQGLPISLGEESEIDTVSNVAGPPIDIQQQGHDDDLPPRHILKMLLAKYLKHGHSWMNILDPEWFEANMFDPNQIILLHSLTVFGFKYWTDPLPDLDTRRQYVEKSREKILALAMESISFSSAQGLAFLAFDALGQGPSSKTLNVMSLLHTAINQLGLTRSVDDMRGQVTHKLTNMVRNQVNDSDGRECEGSQRARLFWAAYVLDRIIGVSHGLECRIAPNLFRRMVGDGDEVLTPAKRIDVLIDDVRKKTERDGLSESFCVLVQISTLIERVNEFIMRPVDLCDFAQSQEWKGHFRALDAALCAWRDSQLSSGQTPLAEFDPVFATAKAIFHTAVIRLQSVAAFPPKTCSHFTASPLAPRRCQQEIEDICRLCESISPSDYSHFGPLFVFAVWVAARNMVTLWTSGWEERTTAVPPELAILRSSLRTLSDYWPCAQHFTAMIDLAVDVNDETNDISNLAVFNDISKTAFGLQNVLGPRIKHNHDTQMAQLWDWFSIPGMDGNNLFL